MLNIEPIKLLAGTHSDTGTTGQGCFMNVISYLNGEPQITDQSECVCITIKPIAIWLNDFANDVQRQRLLPYVLRAMGTATNDKEVIKKRLIAVVRFAEFNARLAAKYAKYAANSAKYTANSAEHAANSANSAKHAANSAKYAAESAKYAANSAKHAAEYAKHAAESATIKDAIFDAGIEFLEAACNPPMEADQTIIKRANTLIKLANTSEVPA